MQNGTGVLRTIQNDQFFHLLDAIPSGIAYVDSQREYRYVNQAYQSLIRKTSDEIVGKKVFEVISAENYIIIKPHIDRVLNGHLVRFQHELLDENKFRVLDVTYTPDLKSKKIQGYTVHIVDVTRQNIAEREFKDYVENGTIGLHWVDAKGIITWANRAEMEMLGYRADEYIGRHISEFHADQNIISDILTRLSRNETLNHYEAVLRAKDGSPRHVLINSNVLWQNGKFVHTRCFTMDVTAKKRAEQEVKKSVLHYEQLINVLPIAVYTCDKLGYIRMYNDAAVEMWGRKPEIGKELWCGSWKFYRSDNTPVKLEDCPMAVTLKEARAIHGDEFIIERPDGTKRHIRPFPKPLTNDAGEVTGAVNAVIDITLQKEAEIALKESESFYKQLVNNLPVAIYTCDADGYVITYNKAAADLWGREPEIGKDLWCGSWKIFKEDGSELPLDSCPMALALKEKQPVLGREIVVQKPDGIKVNVAPNPYPLFDREGKMIGAVNLLLNITDQKLAMRALMESEDRFKTVANQTPVILWMMDTKGEMVYLNPKWTSTTGQNVNKALALGWIDYIHADDREKVIQVLNDSVSKAQPFEMKFRCRNAEDYFLILKFSASPRFSPESRLVGFIGTMLDVTLQENLQSELEREIQIRTSDLLQKNRELRKSEERYHRMVTEVQDYAIILLSRDGIIENWNYGAEKIKGYKAEEAIGKSFKMFYTDGARAEKLPDMLLAEAERNGRATHEGWRVRKNGTLFWGSVVLTALHDESNNLIGFSKVTRDLTERKTAEDAVKMNALKLEEKNRELEKINQELASFAYVSSHDLQEPLRKIQTFSSRIMDLEQNNFSEKGREYFGRIQNSAHRMRILIDDLLAYSRANATEKKFVTTDLNALLEDVKIELKESITLKKAKIFSSHLPTIDVIPFQFQQLLINILSNSLKFSKDSVHPVITISHEMSKEPGRNLKRNGDMFHLIRISDNGIGFEPAFSNQIFEIFQRLHNRNDYEGTGVGLAICKKIAENHNGFITAEGRLNEGATFNIYIPE